MFTIHQIAYFGRGAHPHAGGHVHKFQVAVNSGPLWEGCDAGVAVGIGVWMLLLLDSSLHM